MADDARTALVRAMVQEGTSDDDILAALKVYDAKHAPSMRTASGETWTDKLKTAASMLQIPLPGGGTASPQAIGAVASAGVQSAPAIGGAIGSAVGGAPGAAIGGAAGQGYKTLLNNASQIPGAVRDVAGNLIAHPMATLQGAEQGLNQGALQAGTEGAMQGAMTGAGNLVSAGLAKAAPVLMQSAVKPSLALLKEYRITPEGLSKVLLREGANVTPGGLSKLQRLVSATNDEIRDAVANAPGTIAKNAVAARVLPTAQRVANQVNPTADLRAVGDTVTEFLNNPVSSSTTLTVPEAQAMKVGTYRAIGSGYGEMSGAQVEAQKALARGLKEDIAAEVPQITALNARDSELMAAQDAVGRRIALSGNRDPAGLAWVTHNPMTFLAMVASRNEAVKSLLARGLYASAARAGGVSEQALRLAVNAAASSGGPQQP
jgi:hypothetical protein